MNKKTKIIHLGKEIRTSFFSGELDKDEIQHIRENFFETDKAKALKQLEGLLLHDKSAYHSIHRYYFEKIASFGKRYDALWTLNELLDSDELVQLYLTKTQRNEKVFPKSSSKIRNFRTALRIGGSSNVGVLTTFSIKDCKAKIQEHIGEGKTFLDPCCGWGSRMIASACLDFDYIGFETNALLIPKLKELGEYIKRFKPEFKYTIYEQGFQETVSELFEQADIVFTSPPYYNLESYGNNDFEKENTVDVSYEEWLEKFIRPFLENTRKYAHENTKILINIKNFKQYFLCEDVKTIAKELGMEFLGEQEMKTNKRINSTLGGEIKNIEPVLVFKKGAKR